LTRRRPLRASAQCENGGAGSSTPGSVWHCGKIPTLPSGVIIAFSLSMAIA